MMWILIFHNLRKNLTYIYRFLLHLTLLEYNVAAKNAIGEYTLTFKDRKMIKFTQTKFN